MKAKIAEFETGSFERQATGQQFKLPPVAVGNQLQVKIDELMGELQYQKQINQNLQKELIEARKESDNLREDNHLMIQKKDVPVKQMAPPEDRALEISFLHEKI